MEETVVGPGSLSESLPFCPIVRPLPRCPEPPLLSWKGGVPEIPRAAGLSFWSIRARITFCRDANASLASAESGWRRFSQDTGTWVVAKRPGVVGQSEKAWSADRTIRG